MSCLDERVWIVQGIKTHHIGTFATAEEAADARDNFVRAQHAKGQFRNTPRYNTPQGEELGIDMKGIFQRPNGKFDAEITVEVSPCHTRTSTFKIVVNRVSPYPGLAALAGSGAM